MPSAERDDQAAPPTTPQMNYGGATVPRGSGGTTIGNSNGFTLTVHPGTLDVTINATGTPRNA
jgi:hypothetical protein